MVHISVKDINVVLVRLNNKAIPQTEISKLENIYKKAGVNVNVTIASTRITDTGGTDTKIEVGTSNILSIYTNEQKEINEKVKQLSGYNQTTYYMVYSNLQPSKSGIKGFMALSGQFGYVFPSDDAYVAAHELGHGALGLEHPFKTDADQGKTNFLMDYSVKNELWHKDWKQINDPKFRLYNFQGDSEGASDGVKIEKLITWIKTNKGQEAIFNRLDYFTTSSYVDLPQLLNYKNDKITVFVELGTESKIVNLAGPDGFYPFFKFSVDLTNRNHTGFYLDLKYKNQDNSAIKIWTYSYETFKKLLDLINIKIAESSYPKFGTIYNNALIQAANDCNKIDVIYETAPPFIFKYITDDNLYKSLVSLAGCVMNEEVITSGTNEEIAVINILKGFNNKQNLYKTSSSKTIIKRYLFWFRWR